MTTKRSWPRLLDTAVLTVLCSVTTLFLAHFVPVLQSPPNPPPVVAAPQARMRFHFIGDTANSGKSVISSEGVPFDVDSDHTQFNTQGNTYELKQPQK